MGPVGIEERGGGGAIGQGERLPCRPGASGEALVQPGVDLVQQLPGLGDAVAIVIPRRAHPVQHHLLHRRHHIVVEQAIEHVNLDPRLPLRHQTMGAGMRPLEIFDDGAAFYQGAPLIHQHRKTLEGPEVGEFLLHRRRLQVEVIKRDVILVEGDQHLLAVG
ncbi:hypothetical protein D3C78_795070 [compost metagenome]